MPPCEHLLNRRSFFPQQTSSSSLEEIPAPRSTISPLARLDKVSYFLEKYRAEKGRIGSERGSGRRKVEKKREEATERENERDRDTEREKEVRRERKTRELCESWKKQ